MELPLSRLQQTENANRGPSRSLPKTLLFKMMQTVFPDRQFVSILKYELSLLTISIYSKLSPIEWVKTLKRRNATELKINIGNGPFRHEGWLNIDCSISLSDEV